MRIAWLVYGPVTQPTGGYVYDRLIIEGLRAHGDRVDVVDPAIASSILGGDLEGADVLVGDALCAPELGGLFEGARRGQGRVLLVHHFPSWEIDRTDREAMRGLELRALGACDGVVATSQATRARMLAESAPPPIAVVVPGADRLPRLTRSRGGSDVELLFVGSLVSRKGVARLLDALEQVPEPRPALTLVGDPGREPEYGRAVMARVAGSPGLRDRVSFAGVVGEGVLAQRMARADALVLPSSLEGYGMVLTEALYAGLPVLASRAAAIAAGVAHLAAARVFDEDDGLLLLLKRFAVDRALRASMSRAAEEPSLPRWDDAVTAFRQVLLRVQRRP